jgi:hypothetical protein
MDGGFLMWAIGETRVFLVADVNLRVVDGSWAFAARNRADIDLHWERRLRESPAFFNGIVHVLTQRSLSEEGVLSASFVRTDFKSFLYWRETGWRDDSVMDSFGSALILSAEGHALLGRQRAGNMNGGLCYPPCGFIDPGDIGPDGIIDLEGSVAREIAEETGLAAPAIRRSGGYVVTQVGPVLAMSALYRSPLADEALLAEAGRHIAGDAKSELTDFLLAKPGADTSEVPMPDYARALLRHLPELKTPA